MIDSEKHVQLNEIKWDKRSVYYDFKLFDYYRFMQKSIIDELDFQNNNYILDLGCGTGWAVQQIAKKLNNHAKIIGVDISDGMLQKARQKSIEFKNVSFKKSSSDKLPFENNYFDFVICTNSFHHYPKPQKALVEINRVLKKNGLLYVLDVTNDNILANLLNQYFKIVEKEHVQFYNSAEFENMFSESGFKSKIIKSIFFIFKIHCAEKNK